MNMGEFPSGQRGQTVNLLRFASMVRIRPPPPQKVQHHSVLDFLSLWTDSKGRSKQTVRWTVCPAVASPKRSESVCWMSATVRGRCLIPARRSRSSIFIPSGNENANESNLPCSTFHRSRYNARLIFRRYPLSLRITEKNITRTPQNSVKPIDKSHIHAIMSKFVEPNN